MLHWLFPGICRLCGATCSVSLCERCLAALPRVPRPLCLYCGAPVAGEQTDPYHCASCARAARPFAFARSAMAETEQSMSLIHDLKYHHDLHLAVSLAPLLAELWDTTPQLRERQDWTLIPVPITHTRLMQRGYNQAYELARALSRLRGGLPLLEPLEHRDTGVLSQTRLNAARRRRNARQAYHALPAYTRPHATPLPPHLLLVDDVYTTGSTARACAAALTALPGVETVGVLTLLRAM